MLAGCGAADILIAYPMVGPNCGRLARLIEKYPRSKFAVVADHPDATRTLSEVIHAAGQTVEVLIDIDVGQHRTGIAAVPQAQALYEMLAICPVCVPAGFTSMTAITIRTA